MNELIEKLINKQFKTVEIISYNPKTKEMGNKVTRYLVSTNSDGFVSRSKETDLDLDIYRAFPKEPIKMILNGYIECVSGMGRNHYFKVIFK